MRLHSGFKISLVLVGFVCLSFANISPSNAASFEGLGDLPGGFFNSSASGVSADGSVVVGCSWSASGLEAFRWKDLNGNGVVDSDEKLDNHPEFGLGDLPGGSFSSAALDVSADGSVVVGWSSSASGSEAFRWTSGSGMVGLGDLPGGSFVGRAFGVSADGSVVVGEGWSASGREAFRWTDLNGNGVVDSDEKLDNHPEFGLGDLPGGRFRSIAFGVSADGSVVVGRSRSASGREAFRWTSGGGMVGLGDLPGGGFDSHAFDVSADGSVVVGRGISTSVLFFDEAFRWKDLNGNGVVDSDEKLDNHPEFGLGDLPGGSFRSEALDISADGSVVVGFSDSALGGEAFIWDAVNGMRNLKGVLVNDFSLDLTGWTLEGTTGISDDGLTIVGWGTNPTGNPEAWVAVISEPAIEVAVDIKPGSCPNPVNVKSSGVLPVAILGTEDVNVIDIVIASIRLADPNVAPIRNSYEDVAAPVFDANDCNCTTDGPDGFLDLTLKFETRRIVEAIGDVNHGDILTLMLTGVLFDETPIEGADCILIRGRHKPINRADINKDGVVDVADFAIFAENWLQCSVVQD